jgi:hypothetical protein
MNQQNNQNQKMKTTAALSNETLENFKNWVNGWDERIQTHDDRETEQIIKEKLMFGFATIEKLLSESDQKVMSKARGNLIPGSNEANEKEVMAMLENQKKSWYKNLQKVSCICTEVRSTISDIYELKNRRTTETFKLRAENAKLRAELSKLREK